LAQGRGGYSGSDELTMAIGRGSKNNVLAGLFVLAALALVMVVIIVMSNLGDSFTPQSTYIVRFSVLDGAEGLDKGAPVKLGGQRVGRVTIAKIHDDEVSGEPSAVDVTIQIPSRYRLYSDADVQLLKPLLGTGSSINIVSFSGMEVAGLQFQGPPKLLKSGDMIYGRLGAPGFIAPTDYARFQAILARMDRITNEAEPQIKTIMDNASGAVADVKQITADARAKWPQWSQQATDVIARIEKGSQSFESIIANVKDVAQSVKDGVDDARKLIDKGRAVVDDNRPQIDAIVKNVKDVTDRVNGEWSTKVTGLLDQGRAAMDSATATARDVETIVARNRPQLEDIIANAMLASQQLKLATVEIRASPWRLLYQPTKKELENELLYNSVRQYSEAVGELKAASESLQSVVQGSQTGRTVDQKTLDEMTAKLKGAFDKYQEQERAFLERWLKQK
jgi:ABC-type transporter Mla subunit MlaD